MCGERLWGGLCGEDGGGGRGGRGVGGGGVWDEGGGGVVKGILGMGGVRDFYVEVKIGRCVLRG